MKKECWMAACILLGLLVMTPALIADERGDIKQKIEALRAEARVLASRGDEEGASERMKAVRELNARLRLLAQRQNEPQREREEMLHQMARRLDHMRTAAAHLKEAEMPDMAHEVGRRAEELAEKLATEKQRYAEGKGPEEWSRPDRDVPPQAAARIEEEHRRFAELKERLEDQRAAWVQSMQRVKEELMKHIHAVDQIREEQEKMRMEMKELREQLEQLRSATKKRRKED